MFDRSGFRRMFGLAMVVGSLLLWAPVSVEAEVIKVNSDDYASLQGYVYADLDSSCTLDVGEGLISDVIIHCTLDDPVPPGETPVTYTTTTNAVGYYSFTGLPAGTYTLTEEDPIEFMQGLPGNPGTVEGTPVGEANGPDEYTNITLTVGDAGIEYNFGEGGLRSAYLSKRFLLTKQEPPADIPEPNGIALLVAGLALCFNGVARRHARG